MSELKKIQQRLDSARSDADGLTKKYLAAKEALMKNKAAQQSLLRVFKSRNQEDAEKDRSLKTAAIRLNEEIETLAAERRRSREGIKSTVGLLEQAGDPTTLIHQLDDRYPVLLFPLRLETRFKKNQPGWRHRK